MKHPRSEDVQKVIDNFKSIRHLVTKNSQIDMGEVWVQKEFIHECGTVHCHAGWYAVAHAIKDPSIIENGKYVGYETGAKLMAEDLRIISCKHLLTWADVYPEIWGNKYGEDMFSDNWAFVCNTVDENGGGKEIEGMESIIQHWEGVRDRLKELEDKQDKQDKPKEVKL